MELIDSVSSALLDLSMQQVSSSDPEVLETIFQCVVPTESYLFVSSLANSCVMDNIVICHFSMIWAPRMRQDSIRRNVLASELDKAEPILTHVDS
jgi:hypothetical protein